MSEPKFESFSFEGTTGEIVFHRITPVKASSKLALVFPGAGYSYRQPLLHFGIQILLKQNFQVLALDKIYAEDLYWSQLQSEQEAREIVEADTQALFHLLKGEKIHTLFGKSLGTYAIATALEKGWVEPEQIVWQTPALGSKWEIMRDSKARGFGILGTADHDYEKALPSLPQDRIVIENANHGMEISHDPIRSIQILKEVTEATESWLAHLSSGN